MQPCEAITEITGFVLVLGAFFKEEELVEREALDSETTEKKTRKL